VESDGTLLAVQQNERSASVITMLNLKGGVGKTHAAWLIASVCEERHLRCLLIDTDPQGNLSNSFLPERIGVPGVERLLDPSLDEDGLSLVQRTKYEHIDIIPSSPEIARFDEADQRAWERADLHLSLVPTIRAAERLYDFIVFDCPPRLSLTSFAALCASRHLIIPMEAADWGAQGVSQVTEAAEYVQAHFNRSLTITGYLASRFKRSRLSASARMRLSFCRRSFRRSGFSSYPIWCTAKSSAMKRLLSRWFQPSRLAIK
jgi:chromosome partitioning protein